MEISKKIFNKMLCTAKAGISYHKQDKKILYIPASSLPYHISGYTTRTQSILEALRTEGVDFRVLTRPGYPFDRHDRLNTPSANYTLINNIRYDHVKWPSRLLWILPYVVMASRQIKKYAIKHNISIIHAASNYVNALPALFAARDLGIPFQYEMRGLWELTRISREPEYINTTEYKRGIYFESVVAAHADTVFVISNQLMSYINKQWGISFERMSLLPNCVDPSNYDVSSRIQHDIITIGYAGSIIKYEGLDTLIDAVDILRSKQIEIRVQIVGDGESKVEILNKIRDLNLTDRVELLGRMSQHDAHDVIKKCAIVCIPRKPFEVCSIVPPIKLVEALALEKPVVVPDLPVFRNELGDSGAGWFFKSGDPNSLADVIMRVLKNPTELDKAGKRGREYVMRCRSWSHFVRNTVSSQNPSGS